jgi:hydroxymethylglutaryl-CoA reductase
LKNSGALKLEIADKTVENVIGSAHLPLGLATNFVINGKETVVPMAVEEPSVIAAASKAAKQCLPEGFVAEADESIMIGQIQLVNIKKSKETISKLEKRKTEIEQIAKEQLKEKEKYGCGFRKVEFKIIKTDRGDMIITYFEVAVGDAQGANMINSTLEAVAPKIEEISGAKVRLRILSNLAVKRKARATAVWKKEVVGEEVIEGVLDAYEFANNDRFRAVTHNKGIMNGISAVVIASGNDWRSAEAAAHAFASISGEYKPLTKYYKNKNGDLVGEIELPLAVATVGPAINGSPTGKIALKIMGIKSSQELSMTMACVGLANNFAALAALSTVGIQDGHMKLHARSVAIYVGAKDSEVEELARKLSEAKNYNVEFAKEILEKMRKK